MQFFTTAAVSCGTSSAGPRALAPVVHNEKVTIANGAGATAVDLFAGAAGSAAPYSGFVSSGIACSAYRLVVTIITGDDCIDNCDPTPDVLVATQTLTIDVPSGQGVQLPPAFISKITVQTTDGAGTAQNAVVGGDVRFTSSRAGVCSGDILIP